MLKDMNDKDRLHPNHPDANANGCLPCTQCMSPYRYHYVKLVKNGTIPIQDHTGEIRNMTLYLITRYIKCSSCYYTCLTEYAEPN